MTPRAGHDNVRPLGRRRDGTGEPALQLTRFHVLLCGGAAGPFIAAQVPRWLMTEPGLARVVAARISGYLGAMPIALVCQRADGDVLSFADHALATELGAVDFASTAWVEVSIGPVLPAAA